MNWIKCTDQFPPSGKTVLVFDKINNVIKQALKFNRDDEWIIIDKDINGGIIGKALSDIDQISHWSLMPDLPKD